MQFYEGLPEVIDDIIVRTAVEQALAGCVCSRAMNDLAHDLAILYGIPDERKVGKRLEIAKEKLEHTSEFYSTIKGTKCEVPFGSSAQKYLEELLGKDWKKASESLAHYISGIQLEAGHRGGGACSALEILVKALENR